VTANDDRSIREKIRSALLPSGPKSIAEPEKELRFTRAGQAPLFYIIAALTVAAAIGLLILSTQKWGMDAPPLQSWWWLGIPDLLIGFWFFRLGMRCSQHAYLILTPLGIEIFPFFNVGVRSWNVGLWLIIIKVRDKVLNRIVWEKTLQLRIQLSRQRFIVTHQQSRLTNALNDVSHGERLSRAGDT